jgi:hypothetical protein
MIYYSKGAWPFYDYKKCTSTKKRCQFMYSTDEQKRRAELWKVFCDSKDVWILWNASLITLALKNLLPKFPCSDLILTHHVCHYHLVCLWFAFGESTQTNDQFFVNLKVNIRFHIFTYNDFSPQSSKLYMCILLHF